MEAREKEKTFLFATWGDPRVWVRASYLVVKEKEDGSLGIESTNREMFSSTSALKKVLAPQRTKIFVQDSLYLREIIKKEPCESLKRSFIEEKVKKLVQEAKEDVEEDKYAFSEEMRELKDSLAVVPGIISYKDGADIYVWRGEGFYGVLVGNLVEHILKELRTEAASKVKVVVDTTHGVNYFAAALTEACRLASAIYLLEKSLEVDDVRIVYYNSDPLLKLKGDSRGLSLKVNLIAREKLRGVAATLLMPMIENIVTRGLNKAAETLNDHWRIDGGLGEWEKALAACLLFFRGAPLWALRIAQETKVPSSNELLESTSNIELECKESEDKSMYTRTYTYSWSNKRATAEVVVVSEVVAALKSLGKAFHSSECRSRVEEVLRKISDALERGTECTCVKVFAETLKTVASSISETPCYKLVDRNSEKLASVVEKVCTENVSSLFTNEVRELRKTLEKEHGDGCSINGITCSFDCYSRLVVRDKDLVMLISPSEKSFNLRNFYAHAGFARSVLYVATLFNEQLCACPVDWKIILDKLKS